MGASLLGDANVPVEDFDAHIPTMRGFHQRYMVSNKVTRFWADAVRQLDVEMIVPQHGKSFVGKAMINRFLDWIGNLPCGVDLLTQDQGNRTTKPLKSKNRLNCEQKGEPSCSPIRLTI